MRVGEAEREGEFNTLGRIRERGSTAVEVAIPDPAVTFLLVREGYQTCVWHIFKFSKPLFLSSNL